MNFELEIKKLRFQLHLVNQTIQFDEFPIVSLAIEFNWGQADLTTANDIFDKYDTYIDNSIPFVWADFESDFNDKLGIGYQGLKSVVLGFYENNQWQNVCLEYMKAYPVSEFSNILRSLTKDLDKSKIRELLRHYYPELNLSRSVRQEDLVLQQINNLPYLHVYSVQDLRNMLDSTEHKRAQFRSFYKTLSAYDELVRAIAFSNPAYLNDAFPNRNSEFESIFRRIANVTYSESKTNSIELSGNSDLLDAIFDEVNQFRIETGRYYAGRIASISKSSGGAGTGPYPTDYVFLNFDDEIQYPEAKKLVSLIVSNIAAKLGLQQHVNDIIISSKA